MGIDEIILWQIKVKFHNISSPPRIFLDSPLRCKSQGTFLYVLLKVLLSGLTKSISGDELLPFVAVTRRCSKLPEAGNLSRCSRGPSSSPAGGLAALHLDRTPCPPASVTHRRTAPKASHPFRTRLMSKNFIIPKKGTRFHFYRSF
jgi:hypothetical protein